MKWYVWCNGKVLGWVIAASENEAVKAAHQKFELSIEYGPVSVEERSKKRKKS